MEAGMQEEQEEMIKTGKPEKRRPSGFKNGVIIGLVLGLLITGIIALSLPEFYLQYAEALVKRSNKESG